MNLRTYVAPNFEEKEFVEAPNAVLKKVEIETVAPENYHALSIYPEYFKIDGTWLLAKESRMDCVPVYEDGQIFVREFRHLKVGDLVVCGRSEDASEGIYVYPNGFFEEQNNPETFAFRQNKTRETSFTRDYEEIVELLKYEKEHGKVVWVMGPAFSFDCGAREAFTRLIDGGYVDAVLAGNALATHDLEGAYLKTALGQNIYTRENVPNGHYNHLDTINEVKRCGGIKEFIKAHDLNDGIVCALERNKIPYVLGGSIRDDGPLPPVYGNVYEAQDAMRKEIREATTVICMATMLHTIAVGNMTPSYRVLKDGTVRQVYFYCVDVSEFMVNKLADRGSLSSRGVVTNVQDFIIHIANALV